jgi:hypothetical protein
MSRIITYSQIIFKGSLSLLIIFNLASTQALAGGGDDPSIQPETLDTSNFENAELYQNLAPANNNSKPVSNNNQNISASSNFSWDEWSQPYWLNNQVCREQSGNIACFEADQASQLHWEIPPQN